MKRCLVVGGNGFIGSHVVDQLAGAGYEVSVFDRMSNGIARFESRDVRAIPGDFLNADEVSKAVKGHQVVFHLLSTSSPVLAEADPLFDIRTNVLASIELFRIAADVGVEHLYFASTGGAIYGEQSSASSTEESPTRPVSPYAIGKLTLERYLAYFSKSRALQSTAFRISNPYGPRQGVQRRQGVIPIFMRQMRDGLPVTLLGDGSMTRDYIYVEDLARLLVRPLRSGGSRAPIYNLGSGVSTALSEVLRTVEEVTSIRAKVETAPLPSTFVQDVRISTELFRSHFGALEGALSLREGIARTWEAIRDEEHRLK